MPPRSFLFYFMHYMIYVIIFCFCVGGFSCISQFGAICGPSPVLRGRRAAGRRQSKSAQGGADRSPATKGGLAAAAMDRPESGRGASQRDRAILAAELGSIQRRAVNRRRTQTSMWISACSTPDRPRIDSTLTPEKRTDPKSTPPQGGPWLTTNGPQPRAAAGAEPSAYRADADDALRGTHIATLATGMKPQYVARRCQRSGQDVLPPITHPMHEKWRTRHTCRAS